MFTTIVVTVPVEIAIHLWLVGLRFISTVPTTEKKHDFRYLAKYNVINSKNAIFTSWHRFISSGPTIHNLDRHKSPRNCTYPRSSLKEWFFGVRICCSVEIFRAQLRSNYSENISRNACVQVHNILNFGFFLEKFGWFKTAMYPVPNYCKLQPTSTDSATFFTPGLRLPVSSGSSRCAFAGALRSTAGR